MPATRSRQFALSLILCGIIFSVTLTYPFNNDNALYAYMGDLLLHGHLPYIGSWDQNYPGIVLIHAFQIVTSGHSQLAFHAFDILIQLIGSALLYKIGTFLLDSRAGALAAILGALYYVQQGLWMAGERDTYVTILLLAAFSLWLCEPKGHRFWIGLLAGSTLLLRPTYGLYAPVFLMAFLREPSGTRLRSALLVIIGAALPFVLFLLVYLPLGGLRDFWEATFLFNMRVYGGTGTSFDFWQPVRFYAISSFAVASGSHYLWKTNRPALYVWTGLFAASLISLILLYRHSVYHYHPAMTLFILLSAIGWTRVIEWTKWNAWAKQTLTAGVVLFFVFQTLRGNTVQHVLIGIAQGEIRSFDDSYAQYEPSKEFGYPAQLACSQYLISRTKPGDTVQMFGPYSYPQYHARLTSASRFQTIHALAMRGNDTLMPFQQRWRREYLADMRQKHPKYFIVCDAPEAFRQYYGGRLGHEILREDFRELGAWLDSNYYAETKIGAFTLYRVVIHN
ncbi:MAG: glycosyltransferase family 39 protein [Bacteroidota bacterium]|nr:glycosyltransferase family 39 protein [Bacteroidota bacterium]MDP4232873.1 glycosyltransferase family 39 protein [Bacteroidota bacterium]MDP4241917.1 glycosyltransferase family 39 protein [Bacteroidota bacterium]MDP4288243.1 glycosyltransferase family 39 protein [Bacteroidota bacterium]